MEVEQACHRLAEALEGARLVVLIGSGILAGTKRATNSEYSALTPQQAFVANVAKHRQYVDPSWAFVRTCDEISQRESRAVLEDLLVKEFQHPAGFNTSTAHRILACLPFDAYITPNYDQFLENELERVHRRPSVIICNDDLARARRGSVSVIKYYGCVSKPETMVATSVDHAELYKHGSLVRQLITVNLAKGNLLVIGHGSHSSDLEHLLNDFLKDLSEYPPKIYVIREPPTVGEKLRIPFRHELVYEDLTKFLNCLAYQCRMLPYKLTTGSLVPDEDWLSSVFFSELNRASVLPSETQVLDAFLSQLLAELEARNEVPGVRADAAIAVKLLLNERPNYKALVKMWREIENKLVLAGDDVAGAKESVQIIIKAREQKKAHFRQLGKTIIKRGERVLVFSQSQRVIQTLLGVASAIQKTCELFVAECRPKSPYPYEDAAAICRELSGTDFSVSVCPDVVAINLLATRQIDKVLMGAHAIYVDNAGERYAFINTCGSLALALAAERYEVPVIVIGEVIKLDAVPREEADDHLFKHHEHDLQIAAPPLADLSTKRGSIHHTNIGYDLVPVSRMITIEVPDAVASTES